MKKSPLHRAGLVHDFLPAEALGKIGKRFTYPPFSILNAREGIWQRRKRLWLSLGIKSELGRFEGQINIPGAREGTGQTFSIEDLDEMRNRVSPGHSPRPAADYGKSHARGDGAGRPIGFSENGCGDYRRSQGKYKKRKKTFGVNGEQEKYHEDEKQKKRSKYTNAAPGSKGDHRPDRAGGEYDGGHAWLASDDDAQTGTSIFDPVLTELCYRWFTPTGAHILDPFAGGSVRGIVAAALERRYTGIELRPEQAAANTEQAEKILAGQYKPNYVIGDARNVGKLTRRGEWADFIFSCPPYGDLEIYSDDPRDLSQMPREQFLETYRKIIRRCCRKLRPDRFACFVVGDYRLKDGHYANFTADTIAAFAAAGLPLYNSAILVTAVGSLPIRIGKQMESGRKLGRTHQDVLIFVKGNWKKAAAYCGKIE